MQIILGRLGIDLITNPIARIDSDIRGDLLRPGKCTEHALGDRLGVNADDRCQGAIYLHIELRQIIWLLNPQIDCTWSVLDLFHQPVRELRVRRQVSPCDLNVNRRG
jgi:hypothetical protein